MKPLPRYDFPVNIRPYIWEVDEKVRPFFEGILEVTLNFHIAVVFVPEIESSVGHLLAKIPDNIDDVNSQLEARLSAVARESYSVTPNALLAGKEEIIPPLVPEVKGGIVYYVSPLEFEIFTQEIITLSEEIGRVANSRKISELEEFDFAKFILSRVITTNKFQEFDLRILGRC